MFRPAAATGRVLRTRRLTKTFGVMDPPTLNDWGEIDNNDLDAKWAFKQFFGKSFEQAVDLFESNALYYQEDLGSMPKSAFNFYAPAFASYLESERSAGDSDGASSFLHLLVWMLKTHPESFDAETAESLLKTADKIAQNQRYYDADVDIYGRFPDLNNEIKKLAAKST